MEPTTPLLSVLIITYNQEAYIQQAIDSVLAQKTDFNFEIVIGDDASTDQTRAICATYAANYPKKIRLLPAMPNMGCARNFIQTLKACCGVYIAHLDGDDYWIDDLKLQKQVNAFKKDAHLTLCFTGRRIYHESTDTYHDIIDGADNQPYHLADFASNIFFHLSTAVFKKPTNLNILDNVQYLKIVDRPLYIILLAEMGGYAIKIADICTVFRMNNTSLFTPASELKRNQIISDTYQKLKAWYPQLTQYFNHHLTVADYFHLRCAFKEQDKPTVRDLAMQILKRTPLIHNWQLKLKAALHIPMAIF